MDSGNSIVNTVLVLAALGVILALWKGWIKLPAIGNPFGWIKLSKWKIEKGSWLWSGIVWLCGPVPLAFISAHAIMLFNPVSHNFMLALIGKDWEDPARYLLIAGEIWFVFVLYRLYKTSWAKHFIAIIPGIPLMIGLHLFLTAFFPQYNAFTKETWAKIENMPAPQWSSKSATVAPVQKRSVLESIPFNTECGSANGPGRCRGRISTMYMEELPKGEAEAPLEFVVWKPDSSAMCWRTQPKDVITWRGPDHQRLSSDISTNTRADRITAGQNYAHVFTATTTEYVEFAMIPGAQVCPDDSEWDQK